ncbi:MAG: hypothetical protein JXR03_15675 [Cyclobacteriaceae bacterium]
MKNRIRRTLLFVAAIVAVQQLSYWLGNLQPSFKSQKEMILARDMEPALLFYTESEHALEAEKEVRNSLD